MDNVKNDAYYIKRLKQDLEFVVRDKHKIEIFSVRYTDNF